MSSNWNCEEGGGFRSVASKYDKGLDALEGDAAALKWQRQAIRFDRESAPP
jgi:hypothetical protein